MRIIRLHYILICCISLLILLCSVFSFAIYQFYSWSNSPLLTNQSATTIIVYPGMDMPKFIASLQQRKLLLSPRYFSWLAVLKKANLRMKSGEYLLTPHTTPNQLLTNIIRGHVYMRKITFIEGCTFKQMRNILNNNPYVKHTTQNVTDQHIMQILHADNKPPEGLFFPDTYKYTWGNSDVVLLKSAYQLMQRILQQKWPERAADLPYQNPYEALIVASMIEHETALPSEKYIIAGIILHRWQLGMRLQIDPTVLYGVGKSYGSVITHLDLMNQNPYNTYRRSGLPPTPIGMPDVQSIIAALHPKKSNFLYYVAKGDGSHTFSVSYKDHLAAVVKYRQIHAK